MGKIIRKRRRALSRRDFMTHAGLGAASLPLLTAGCGSNHSRVDSSDMAPGGDGDVAVFLHGIASGDPLSDRVVFWTRVTTTRDELPVSLEIYRDPALTQAVTSAEGVASEARDHTVKLDVAGLEPATTYYYRFLAAGSQSAIGRTRTAPVEGVEQLRFAVVSCASAAHGYFNAYRALAQRSDLDAILHTGDYIYEYGSGEYGDVRPYEPEHEIVTLQDYRTRHGFYKKDPDLMELHRQFPFITTWDDHETADNSWREGAANHTEGEEGAWGQRKAWGLQAYDEWMPVRYPEPGNIGKIWRKFNYGNLADLFVLDTRLYDRDEPAGLNGNDASTGAIPADPVTSAEANRRMMGPEQMDWFLGALSASTAQWKIVCQQMVFHQWQLADPSTTGLGLYINGDAWDGYQAERAQILAHLRDNAIDNVVIVSGDVHSSWCADVTEEPLNVLTYDPLTGGAAAVEFVSPAITSPFVLEALPGGQEAFILNNPHIRYLEFQSRGYVLLNLDGEGAQGEYWYVDTFTEPDNSAESFATAYRTATGANHLDLVPVSSPSAGPADQPPLAP